MGGHHIVVPNNKFHTLRSQAHFAEHLHGHIPHEVIFNMWGKFTPEGRWSLLETIEREGAIDFRHTPVEDDPTTTITGVVPLELEMEARRRGRVSKPGPLPKHVRDESGLLPSSRQN